MNILPKFLCRIATVLGFACSAFCLWYTFCAASAIFGKPAPEDTPRWFVECYVLLSSTAALTAIGVAISSVGLARLHVRGAQALTLFSLVPVPLMIMVGASWISPIGDSIGAATGIGLGGLMPMIFTLLPLWAGLLWKFAFPQRRGISPMDAAGVSP